MRDLEQNPYTTEERIKRRLLMEGEVTEPSRDGLEEWYAPPWSRVDDYTVVETESAARVAALEAEDTANPIAATAVVRKDACNTTGPDLDAFKAAFATALTQHDEEYL